MNKGKISCILAAAMITTQFSPVAAFADNKTELISNVSAEDSSNETKYDNTQSFDEEPVNDQNNDDESKENQDSNERDDNNSNLEEDSKIIHQKKIIMSKNQVIVLIQIKRSV